MSTPFLGELRPFSFNFAPRGWALCNGQLLQINQTQALFALLGTMYGGNGQTTFALPNLQGRVAIDRDNSSFVQGQVGGEAAHTLTSGEVPPHIHTSISANSGAGDNLDPTGHAVAVAGTDLGNVYGPAPTGTDVTTLNAISVATAGSSQPHSNMQPYLVLNFCIALQGIFPSRN